MDAAGHLRHSSSQPNGEIRCTAVAGTVVASSQDAARPPLKFHVKSQLPYAGNQPAPLQAFDDDDYGMYGLLGPGGILGRRKPASAPTLAQPAHTAVQATAAVVKMTVKEPDIADDLVRLVRAALIEFRDAPDAFASHVADWLTASANQIEADGKLFQTTKVKHLDRLFKASQSLLPDDFCARPSEPLSEAVVAAIPAAHRQQLIGPLIEAYGRFMNRACALKHPPGQDELPGQADLICDVALWRATHRARYQ